MLLSHVLSLIVEIIHLFQSLLLNGLLQKVNQTNCSAYIEFLEVCLSHSPALPSGQAIIVSFQLFARVTSQLESLCFSLWYFFVVTSRNQMYSILEQNMKRMMKLRFQH